MRKEELGISNETEIDDAIDILSELCDDRVCRVEILENNIPNVSSWDVEETVWSQISEIDSELKWLRSLISELVDFKNLGANTCPMDELCEMPEEMCAEEEPENAEYHTVDRIYTSEALEALEYRTKIVDARIDYNLANDGSADTLDLLYAEKEYLKNAADKLQELMDNGVLECLDGDIPDVTEKVRASRAQDESISAVPSIFQINYISAIITTYSGSEYSGKVLDQVLTLVDTKERANTELGKTRELMQTLDDNIIAPIYPAEYDDETLTLAMKARKRLVEVEVALMTKLVEYSKTN